MRLDAQHQQVFNDISFQDGDKYLYERLLCPGDTLLQFLAPTDNYDAEPPNVPSHKLASSGKSGKVNLKRLRMWMPDTVVFAGLTAPSGCFPIAMDYFIVQGTSHPTLLYHALVPESILTI